MSSEEDYRRILREEALVTSGELRIEVARIMQRSIIGDEDVLLHDEYARYRCPYQMTRKRRETVVNGSYHRHSSKTDMFRLTGSLTETVKGNIMQTAQMEAEHIVGGVYAGTWIGPFVRMVAYSDFLAWGGWMSVDASRVELIGLAIRSYMGVVQNMGMRIVKATTLIDDWQLRTENYGTFVDNQVDSIMLGGPGAGTQLHT